MLQYVQNIQNHTFNSLGNDKLPSVPCPHCGHAEHLVLDLTLDVAPHQFVLLPRLLVPPLRRVRSVSVHLPGEEATLSELPRHWRVALAQLVSCSTVFHHVGLNHVRSICVNVLLISDEFFLNCC